MMSEISSCPNPWCYPDEARPIIMRDQWGRNPKYRLICSCGVGEQSQNLFSDTKEQAIKQWNEAVRSAPTGTPAEIFGYWLGELPKMAESAGCYVEIKVTQAKDENDEPTTSI